MILLVLAEERENCSNTEAFSACEEEECDLSVGSALIVLKLLYIKLDFVLTECKFDFN